MGLRHDWCISWRDNHVRHQWSPKIARNANRSSMWDPIGVLQKVTIVPGVHVATPFRHMTGTNDNSSCRSYPDQTYLTCGDQHLTAYAAPVGTAGALRRDDCKYKPRTHVRREGDIRTCSRWRVSLTLQLVCERTV